MRRGVEEGSEFQLRVATAERRIEFCNRMVGLYPLAIPGNMVLEKYRRRELNFFCYRVSSDESFVVEAVTESLRRAVIDVDDPAFAHHADLRHGTFRVAVESTIASLRAGNITSKIVDLRELEEGVSIDASKHPAVRLVMETPLFEKETTRPAPLQWFINWSDRNWHLSSTKVTAVQRRKELTKALRKLCSEQGVATTLIAATFASMPVREIMNFFSTEKGRGKVPSMSRRNGEIHTDEAVVAKLAKMLMARGIPSYARMFDAYREALELLADNGFLREAERVELGRPIVVLDKKVKARVVLASLEEQAYMVLEQHFVDLKDATHLALEDLERFYQDLGPVFTSRVITAFLVHDTRLVRW